MIAGSYGAVGHTAPLSWLPLGPLHVPLIATYRERDGTAECRECGERCDVDRWSWDVCSRVRRP